MKQMHNEMKELKENIEKSRTDLNRIIEKVGPGHLNNAEVIRISKELDELINQYYENLKIWH